MMKLKRYFFLSVLTALFAEVYIMPLRNNFRISAGIIVLNLVVLLGEELSMLSLTVLSGLLIITLRTLFHIAMYSSNFNTALTTNLPSFAYYLVYGMLSILVKSKLHREEVFMNISLLALTDILANISETLLRAQTTSDTFKLIVAAGLFRSLLAYLLYFLYNQQQLFIVKREHQLRYSQLNILASSIQAELFYLRKSAKDMESIMSKSYRIYERYKDDGELREETLTIAREIHEIKKDYYRITKGLEALVKSMESQSSMSLSSVIKIIRENTTRYIMESGKDIKIEFIQQDDPEIGAYYSLFTVLNNLIVNGIEACRNGASITVGTYYDKEILHIVVKDTGEGIEEDILPHIFNPGFTTKYDFITGETSTGIGLYHVKNIVEDLGGNIATESITGVGTTFKVDFPLTTGGDEPIGKDLHDNR